MRSHWKGPLEVKAKVPESILRKAVVKTAQFTVADPGKPMSTVVGKPPREGLG